MSAKKDYMFDEIHRLYKCGFSITEISKLLPVSRPTISRILNCNNINIRYTTTFDKAYDVKQIEYSPYIEELNPKNYKKNYGKSKVGIDFAFFNGFSHELAYVLGWMITDGNIYLKNKRVSLTIKDTDHAYDLFSMFLNGHSLKTYTPSNGENTYGVVSICNEDLCKLFMSYGIYPNKTYTCKMPHIPREYVRDFVRGVFEGDGCFSIKNSNARSSNIEITSASTDFLKGIGVAIQEQTGLLHTTTKAYKDKSMKLTYNHHQAIVTLFDFMYSGVPQNMILKRKFEKMKVYIESVVRNDERCFWNSNGGTTPENQQIIKKTS